MLVERVHGHERAKATVVGQANGDEPQLVYSNGLYEGVRANTTRWVTGTKVQAGIDSGILVAVDDATDDQRAQHDAAAELDAAGRRDHVVSPEGAMFAPVAATGSADWESDPVPETSETGEKLADMSKAELYEIAQDVGLEGRSGMSKDELYEHLRGHPDVDV